MWLVRLEGRGDWSKSVTAKLHFSFSVVCTAYLWLFPLVSYFRIVHCSVHFAGSGFEFGKAKGKTSSTFLLYVGGAAAGQWKTSTVVLNFFSCIGGAAGL